MVPREIVIQLGVVLFLNIEASNARFLCWLFVGERWS
jgi:hypothetical protein